MRIVKTSIDSHRYAKVLSTESAGMIGRIYLEVEQRKEFQDSTKTKLVSHSSALELLGYQVDSIKVQNKKISNMLDQIFPDGESWAVIDRSLIIEGKVRGESIQLTNVTGAPIEVVSTELVKNLNVEMVGGSTIADIGEQTDAKVGELAAKIEQDIEDVHTSNENLFAPKSHVNAGGPGVHPYVTSSLAGFMSPTDKFHHDNMKQKVDKLNLPGGMTVSFDAPLKPVFMEVWVDLSEWKPVPEPETPVEPEPEIPVEPVLEDPIPEDPGAV